MKAGEAREDDQAEGPLLQEPPALRPLSCRALPAGGPGLRGAREEGPLRRDRQGQEEAAQGRAGVGPAVRSRSARRLPRGPEARAVTWSAPPKSGIERRTRNDPLPDRVRRCPRHATRRSCTSTTPQRCPPRLAFTSNSTWIAPFFALSRSFEVAPLPQVPVTRTPRRHGRARRRQRRHDRARRRQRRRGQGRQGHGQARFRPLHRGFVGQAEGQARRREAGDRVRGRPEPQRRALDGAHPSQRQVGRQDDRHEQGAQRLLLGRASHRRPGGQRSRRREGHEPLGRGLHRRRHDLSHAASTGRPALCRPLVVQGDSGADSEPNRAATSAVRSASRRRRRIRPNAISPSTAGTPSWNTR
jgi:hypothetical protein